MTDLTSLSMGANSGLPAEFRATGSTTEGSRRRANRSDGQDQRSSPRELLHFGKDVSEVMDHGWSIGVPTRICVKETQRSFWQEQKRILKGYRIPSDAR